MGDLKEILNLTRHHSAKYGCVVCTQQRYSLCAIEPWSCSVKLKNRIGGGVVGLRNKGLDFFFSDFRNTLHDGILESLTSMARVIDIADFIQGVKILSSPRIFQTYLILYGCTSPNTALIKNRLGPFIAIKTLTVVVILMIEYNHIIGYLHADGSFDGIHDRKGNLVTTCEVNVRS